MSNISPPKALNVNKPSNIAEDVYNAFSIRMSSIANYRPIWLINLSVDQVAFYIGAIGSVSMGYALNQFEPPNIDNPNYVNEQGENAPGFITSILKNTITNPFKIIQRFFVGGGLYILIGFATSSMLKGRFARTFASGGLTGLYFSCGDAFSTMVKSTFGFATFSLVMEGLWYLAVKTM